MIIIAQGNYLIDFASKLYFMRKFLIKLEFM